MGVVMVKELSHGNPNRAKKPNTIDNPVTAVSLMSLEVRVGVLHRATMLCKLAAMGNL